ncbi:serine hydrolase domain-containing protein [Liquorilactobacillus capillatus]|nr:serine hydrolase domain-containing protein [Liquorilactobacillus capillatus]
MNKQTVRMLHQLVEEKIVPGVSYAMLHHGNLQAEVFGKSQLIPVERNLKPGLLYDVASLTKVIGTTTVILKLIEEGKIGLDMPVQEYLPHFFDTRVTVRHLLTHTSAITGYIQNRDSLTAQQLLDALYTLHIGGWFGKKVVYTDIGMIFLGLIIEKVYQKPVQKVITMEVLQPLKMNESTFTPAPKDCVPTELSASRGLICGQVHDPKANIIGERCGSAGLFTSLHDVLKFAMWILETSPTKKVLREETITELFKDQTPTGQLGRSLGWDLRYNKQNKACLYHTGFTGTFLLIDKVSQDGLVVLTNRVHPNSANDIFLAKRDQIIAQYLQEKD